MCRTASLHLPLVALACATPGEEAFRPPEHPVVYRKADCPSGRNSRPLAGEIASKPAPPLAGGGEAEDGSLVVTHGGVGTPAEVSDGPTAAASRALELLVSGGSALEAAIEGTAALEDDPRFNAGTGANIRIDGRTIQMDASLMTSDGDFAAVAVIERVRNPIRVARLVLDSPHVFLAGEGATRFAHKMGVKDEVPESREARKKYEERMAALKERMQKAAPGEPDWKRLWNYPGEIPSELGGIDGAVDTVGTVARDSEGRFAATLSTGGTSITLYGRVGDVPVYGAGLFAGPYGAVACTGTGEEIIRQGLARKVYELIASGYSARRAVDRAVREFPEDASAGIIAVDRFGWGVAATQAMAYGVASDGPS